MSTDDLGSAENWAHQDAEEIMEAVRLEIHTGFSRALNLALGDMKYKHHLLAATMGRPVSLERAENIAISQLKPLYMRLQQEFHEFPVVDRGEDDGA